MRRWWLRLLGYARPHALPLAGLGLAILLQVALEALRPWPLKLAVDHALTGEPLPPVAAALGELPGAASAAGLLAWLAAATVLIFLGIELLRIGRGTVQTGLGNRMVFELGADLFAHLQRLSLRFHGQRRTGDLVRRVMVDSRCVRALVMGVAIPVVTSLMQLSVLLVVIWQLDPVLAWVALSTALPLAVVVRRAAGPMAERDYEFQQIEGEMMSLTEQSLVAMPAIQVHQQESIQEQRFRAEADRGLRAYLRSIAAQLRFQLSTQTVVAVGTAATLFIGGLHVLSGQLSIGSLLVVLAYVASLYAPMETLAYLSTGYASAAANARRVFELLETETEVSEAPAPRDLPAPGEMRGALVFERVCFGYEPDRPVLREVSIEVETGETLALVGPSGAGKTTLASLIPRLHDPWQGRVLLDGIDLREIRLASLRERVALVLQDPFLLPVSVADNIAYGAPGADRELVEAAAREAMATAFIERLPQGFDTILDERASALSGGQRQRIAIARALLKDAPVLVLDEATASLDVETESLLVAAFERLRAGRTTVVIAHRLTTIQKAHRIAFLREGRVVEIGSHGELLERGGDYARFHGLQLAGRTPGEASGGEALGVPAAGSR